MSSVEKGQMSNVETGRMSLLLRQGRILLLLGQDKCLLRGETNQMCSVETGHV